MIASFETKISFKFSLKVIFTQKFYQLCFINLALHFFLTFDSVFYSVLMLFLNQEIEWIIFK